MDGSGRDRRLLTMPMAVEVWTTWTAWTVLFFLRKKESF
jgi:hypothetical protein